MKKKIKISDRKNLKKKETWDAEEQKIGKLEAQLGSI